MKTAFIILAHNQPEAIRRLAETLTEDGGQVVVHFDTGASPGDKEAVRRIAAERPDQVRIVSKVHCVWGEWSLVEAVLVCLREIARLPDPPDYVHLMSGADVPIRPLAEFKEFLRLNPGQDFIECCDITRKAWVKGGLSKERFRFYFPVNFRTSRNTFDRLVRWHRKLRIRRRMPLGLVPHMGSQWWTLRWSTCAGVVDFIDNHPQVPRFFRWTWIPDESFFQTVIARIVPKAEIADLQLMFHHLTASGRPYVFHDDHLPVIRKLPHFFIRKVSPAATALAAALRQPGPPRRIPQPRHLARARDLVRTAIDRNHWLDRTVPGHCDLWYQPELEAVSGPMVVLLVGDRTQLPQIEAIVQGSPDFCWLGSPFSPRLIAMPEAALERMGMTPSSWKLRDAFRQQFVHMLATCAGDRKIPVAAIHLASDTADLPALDRLPELLPLIIGNAPLKPHEASFMASRIFASSPRFLARSAQCALEALPRVLGELAAGVPRRADPLVKANPTDVEHARPNA